MRVQGSVLHDALLKQNQHHSPGSNPAETAYARKGTLYTRAMTPMLPPLSLYVHLPWCVRKCPYCDFNSHAVKATLPEAEYVQALLRDLEHDLPRVWGRRVSSIFIGGGTPSLFSAGAIQELLAGIRARITVLPAAEITLEANPGTADAGHFAGYRKAGVNRLSMGVQSFSDDRLQSLGRIHSAAQAEAAFQLARQSGFDNINIDLMYGLPGQTTAQLHDDLVRALALAPEHLSYYQLTLEPNTLFYAQPPALPDEDVLASMQERVEQQLAAADYEQYEVSAYARPGRQCRHNLNYWTFGDYLGIGAGAHGKLTGHDSLVRLWKVKHPREYLARAGQAAAIAGEQQLADHDRVAEFMLNALRLTRGFESTLFESHTGLPLSTAGPQLQAACERGLLLQTGDTIRPSELGRRFLNDLVQYFLPDPVELE